jgi:heat shock protein HslJ
MPLPTIGAPTVATVQPTSCVDGMRLIEHLFQDDQGTSVPLPLRPNRRFIKGWRIQNTGTCLWDPGYSIVYAGGNHAAAHMNGATIVIHGRTLPSETYDVEVKLITPSESGLYQGYWRMRNAQGTYFGDRLPFQVEVAAPRPTLEPTWTPHPATTIQFNVDRDRIVGGECAVFSWIVTNAKALYFVPEGQPWQTNGVPLSGQRQVCPTQTTTYYLRVVRPSDWVETRRLVVHVIQPAEAPQIVQFTAQPAHITAGACVTLGWEVKDQGPSTYVRILRDGEIRWDGAPKIGSFGDCPIGIGEAIYTIEAAGTGGTTSLQRIVTISAAPTPTPGPLSGTAWQVLAIGSSVPVGPALTLNFGGDGTVSGWGSCNTYGGVYQQAGSQLTIGSIQKGDNVCTAEMVLQEQAFLEALQATASFGQSTGQLVLRDSQGEIVLNVAQTSAAAP